MEINEIVDLPMFHYEPASPKHLRLHQVQKKIRAMLGGNRAGKTYWGAIETIWTIYGCHPYFDPFPPPVSVRICCVDEQHGIKEIMLPMFKQLLPEGTYHYRVEPKTLDVSVGDGYIAHIKFLTYEMDLDKFGGTSQHLVWMDEEPKTRAQYTQNLMRTIDTKGRVIMTMTPLFGMTWAYDEIVEGNPETVEYDTISIYDNKYLDPKEIKTIEDTVDPDMVDAVIHGRFISPRGLVYKSFDTVHHVREPLDRIPPEWMVVLGIDTHESIRNPHAVSFIAITKDNEHIIFDEIQQECLISELAKMILERLAHWNVDYRFGVMDISPENPLAGINHKAELIRNGVKRLEVANKAKGTPQEGRAKVKELLRYDEESGLKPALYVTNNCQMTIWQFRHYIYDDWRGKTKDIRSPKDDVRKKDDHLMDAVRYVIYKNIRWRPKRVSLPKPDGGGKHLIRF